jgi:hypothetical protein
MRTYADVSDLERDIGFKPSTSIEDGLRRFVDGIPVIMVKEVRQNGKSLLPVQVCWFI